jgi:hypothetical protein
MIKATKKMLTSSPEAIFSTIHDRTLQAACRSMEADATKRSNLAQEKPGWLWTRESTAADAVLSAMVHLEAELTGRDFAQCRKTALAEAPKFAAREKKKAAAEAEARHKAWWAELQAQHPELRGASSPSG